MIKDKAKKGELQLQNIHEKTVVETRNALGALPNVRKIKKGSLLYLVYETLDEIEQAQMRGYSIAQLAEIIQGISGKRLTPESLGTYLCIARQIREQRREQDKGKRIVPE